MRSERVLERVAGGETAVFAADAEAVRSQLGHDERRYVLTADAADGCGHALVGQEHGRAEPRRRCRRGCSGDRLDASRWRRHDGRSAVSSPTLGADNLVLVMRSDQTLYDRCARPELTAGGAKPQVRQLKTRPLSSVGRASPW